MQALLLRERCLILRCRSGLERSEPEVSAEGAVLLVELLDNYKMNFYNIREAIEVTALTIEDAPHTRKLMFDLSKGLNRAGDNVQIRKLLDNFRYSVGTSWASVLSDNIYLAVTSGMRIETRRWKI